MFIELHNYNTGEPILIKKESINTVYVISGVTAVKGHGFDFDVRESYNEIKKMFVPETIEMKYSEEDQECIKRYLEELQAYPNLDLIKSVARWA